MKTTTSGYEFFFGLVVETEKTGEREKTIVNYSRPGQVPFIGITVIRVDPQTREYFEVKTGAEYVQAHKKEFNLWKFLSSKETTVTVLDEKEGIGYEFVLSFRQNGSYTELHVSRSRLFASKVVTMEQLIKDLVQAAETSKKRRTHPTSKELQNLIQTFNHGIRAADTPVVVPKNGKAEKKGGYFAEVYREAKKDLSPVY